MITQEDQRKIKDTLLRGAEKIVTTLCPEDLSVTRADGSFKRDCHQYREILFTIKGESFFMLNDMVYLTRPGMVFFLDKWDAHSYTYRPEDNNLLHLWLHFAHDKLYGSVIQTKNGKITRFGKYVTLSNDLFQLINRRWDLLEMHAPCTAEIRDALLRSPINTILEEFALLQFNIIETTAGQTNDITVFLHNYIKNVNGRDCSLEQLEKITGYSRFHLSRLFKKRWQITIGEYINKVRWQFVEEARKRNLKQKEIAWELGFSSPVTFWYWLKNSTLKEHSDKNMDEG